MKKLFCKHPTLKVTVEKGKTYSEETASCLKCGKMFVVKVSQAYIINMIKVEDK